MNNTEQATALERERCAAIAERWVKKLKFNETRLDGNIRPIDVPRLVNYVATKIARTIRDTGTSMIKDIYLIPAAEYDALTAERDGLAARVTELEAEQTRALGEIANWKCDCTHGKDRHLTASSPDGRCADCPCESFFIYEGVQV